MAPWWSYQSPPAGRVDGNFLFDGRLIPLFESFVFGDRRWKFVGWVIYIHRMLTFWGKHKKRIVNSILLKWHFFFDTCGGSIGACNDCKSMANGLEVKNHNLNHPEFAFRRCADICSRYRWFHWKNGKEAEWNIIYQAFMDHELVSQPRKNPLTFHEILVAQ